MKRWIQTSAALLLLAVATTGKAQPSAQRQFPVATLQEAKLSIKKHAIRIWVMNTGAKREEGMMFLTAREVPMNQGMLFVFPTPQPLSFWMKNTLIPLDIAFIGADHHILNIAHMKALDETAVPSNGSALYALEVRSGELSHLGAKNGMLVDLPPVDAME